ncbi:DNA-directed DNA polymerase [Tanacetum coccineum]|uniref:DNA-directed DNA polymerase n=1 Tax=Tanacetum coccineum TaxID=301880 RepID=A0ABQ4ZBG8_9ASTR
MAEYSQKWHNGTSSKSKSTETSDGLPAIKAQLNSLGRENKKVNEKVYAAQVRCEQCKGPHYTKDCPHKEEVKALEEAYYTQFGTPYQSGGQYRATGPGFYQRNNGNTSYPARRDTMEESLSKFMTESAKRHEENSNIIKEIRASTDAAIKNQGGSIKTLELQIGKLSKHSDARKEAIGAEILETYDHNLPQKEKDPGSFTLPCFINNICFDKALVDLGAKLADRTIKQPRGIAENVLVRIGKFVFLIDFIILDIPEDDDVPLILGRPFLATAYVKIDVFKRKVTLRVGEEKLVFKSVKPASSMIKRVFIDE